MCRNWMHFHTGQAQGDCPQCLVACGSARMFTLSSAQIFRWKDIYRHALGLLQLRGCLADATRLHMHQHVSHPLAH
jgi:hypothetical protein